MFTKMTKLVQPIAIGTALVVGGWSSATAADYPSKPIKIMVGFAAGGGTDTTARSFASFLHEEPVMNGMPAVIVNQPGGSGVIAAKTVNEAKSDGYTLYMINSATLGISYLRGGKIKINPVKDFQILGCVSQLVTALAVPQSSPFKTANELLKAAKKPDKKLTWASTGKTSMHGVFGNAVLNRMKIASREIPFKGGAKARNALAAEKTDFAWLGVHLTAGFESKIRVLAITPAQRDSVNPNIPTLGELGLPNIGLSGPMCLFGKSDLPQNVVTKLRTAVKTVSGLKGFKRLMKKSKLAAFYISPEDATTLTTKIMSDIKPVIDAVFVKK